MKPGFTNSTLDVRTSDGLDDILLEPLIFTRLNGEAIRAPTYGTTDGYSVPRCLQVFFPAVGGDWFASVIHDSAYRNQLQIYDYFSHNWRVANYTQREADDLLLEAMKSQGSSWIMCQIIYRSVRLFGHFAYNKDHYKS